MKRYWVPSNPESALFGTKITDRFFDVDTGGDLSFFTGVLKHMIEREWTDDEFIERHTGGWDELRPQVLDADWGVLEKGSEVGAHILSGAVIDPRSLDELLPDVWFASHPLARRKTAACLDHGTRTRTASDGVGWMADTRRSVDAHPAGFRVPDGLHAGPIDGRTGEVPRQ